MPEEDQRFLASIAEIAAALTEVPSRTALVDDQGVIRWQNRASLELRGSRTGRHFSAFVGSADLPRAQAAFDAVLAGGAPVESFVHTFDDTNKSYVKVLCRWNAVTLRDGTTVVVVINLGVTPASAAARAGRAELTRRQLEVLRLLDAGRSTAEIAQELRLSHTTVRNHIAKLLVALGAHSRIQALAAARASGLLS